MRTILFAGGLIAGIAIVVVAVVMTGAEEVGAAVSRLGPGLAVMPLAYLWYLWLLAVAWRPLVLEHADLSHRKLMEASWIGLSVGTLTPAATIGGEMARGRVVALQGLTLAQASGSVVVDQTAQAITLVAWGMISVGLFLSFGPSGPLALTLVAVAAGLGVLIGCFIALQFMRLSARRREEERDAAAGEVVGEGDDRPAGRWSKVKAEAMAVDRVVAALYRDRGRLVRLYLVHFINRGMMALEIWLAAWVMGLPVGILEALVIRHVSGVVRGAAFVLPAGLGVQELSYLALGGPLGLDPEAMLALSLAVRARELIVGVPGLIAWQGWEARRLRDLADLRDR